MLAERYEIGSLIRALAAALLAAGLAAGCARGPAAAEREVILATTTSTQDSGLLDALLPLFEEQTGYQVKVIAVGTGQALQMGRDGNADVLLVHAPAAELELIEDGSALDRRPVMHNDFVLVGPAGDPAGVAGGSDAVGALAQIAAAAAPFVSRGDDSGTHKMELSLWERSGVAPAGEWYLRSGQGMGATLIIASEKAGYTLSDRATYLAQRDTLALEVLVEGDNALLNRYHVMRVNPERWPLVNAEGALAWADFLTSAEGQAFIGAFGVEAFGQPLFVPDA
ncbi:MAG: substrate-binding domain-containing protein [Candidatus Promineifilaceae bacterium]